jgi:hypothetical protein
MAHSTERRQIVRRAARELLELAALSPAQALQGELALQRIDAEIPPARLCSVSRLRPSVLC